MSSVQIFRNAASLAILYGAIAAQCALGQQPRPTNSGAAAAGQANAAPASSEAAAKEKILASPEWQQLGNEFQNWLASQAIYTPADVDRIKANFIAQLQAASASDLQDILDDWQAKLKVLNGRDFQDAQQWLGEYLSVFVDGVRRRRVQTLGLTDISNMSADQLEDAIIRIRSHRLGLQQSRAAFDQNREQMVQRVQQSNAATRQAQQQRTSVAAQFGTNQDPFRPPKFNPTPPPRRQFFVNADGRIAFALPF